MSGEPIDALVGAAFLIVFVGYGFALRQRLIAYRAAVEEAWTDLERRRASGLATAEAERSYDETADALNALLERFPSNVAGRLLKIEKAPLLRLEE